MRRNSKMGSAFELRNSVKRDESMVYCAIALQSSVATRLSHSSSSLSPTSGSEASSDRRSTMSEQLFTASCLQSAVTTSCRSPRRSSRQYVLGCHLSLNKIFSYSSNEGGSEEEHISLITIMFCFIEFAFTVQVKHKINNTQILGFILICLNFTTGHFHTCTLQRM